MFFRSWRRAARVSACIAAFLMAVRFVTEPLHARGIAQPLLGVVNAIGFVFGFPGFAVAGAIGHRAVEHLGTLRFAVAVFGDSMLFFLGLCAVDQVTGRSNAGKNETAPERSGVISRRRLMWKSLDLAAGGALAGSFGYAIVCEPAELRVTRRRFQIRDLPPSLAGLRILQFSDLHHGPWLGLERVREVVQRANALRPDIILLTGDYVSESPAYIDPAVAAIAGLRAGIGIVGVLGNHDWWDQGQPIKAAFARHGIPLIDNTRCFLTSDRKLTRDRPEGLCIAGVGDLWEDEQDYHAALGGLPPSMPRLLLSHNPDVAEDIEFLKANHRVDLMVSGHTHGGQVWIPGLGTPILPSRFGQKYAAGLVQGPHCKVFISRGIGLSGLPVRFGVPPELVLMELTCA